MTDLGDSLQRMGFVQLALLFGFFTTYGLAVGRLLEGRSRLRAALLALLFAAGFVANTEPWEHGALLVVFMIAALGLFVAAAWLLARLVGAGEGVMHSEAVVAVADSRSPPSTRVNSQLPDTAAGALR